MGQCASGGGKSSKREDSADRAATAKESGAKTPQKERQEPQALPEEANDQGSDDEEKKKTASKGSDGNNGSRTDTAPPSPRPTEPREEQADLIDMSPDPAKNPLLVSMAERFPSVRSNSQHPPTTRGIKFYCPTAICGGVGIRENTLTHCGKITEGAQPGLRVDSAAPYWCSMPFTLGNYCTLLGPNKEAEKYYPSADDQYMMVIKGRELTIMSDRTNKPTGTVTLHTGTPQMAKQRAVLEASGISVKSDTDLQRWKITELRSTHDSKTKISISPSVVLLRVKGDPRVTDWPLTSPMASKIVVVEVSGISLLKDIVIESCRRIIGRSYEGASLAVSGKEISTLSDALSLQGDAIELILPPKDIIVNDKKITIPAGSSTTQTLKRISEKVDSFGKQNGGTDYLQNILPSWKNLTHKSTYEIESDILLVEVGLPLGGGSYERIETLRESNLTAESYAAFGVRSKDSRMLITKAKWMNGEECITYNEGTQQFENNIVIGKEVSYYVLQEKDTGLRSEVEPTLMFNNYNRNDLLAIPMDCTPRVRLHASAKEIAVSSPSSSDSQSLELTISVSPNKSYSDIISKLCERFRISHYLNRAYFTCKRTGSVIVPQKDDLWSAVTYDGSYELTLREKPISIIVKADVDVAVSVSIHYRTLQCDVLQEIQKVAGCKCCPGDNWKLTNMTTGESQTLDYQSLSDNGVYVLTQNPKIVFISSKSSDGTVREQDFAVTPHVKPGELWRVITAHPALALQEIWSSLNLPIKNWTTPSENPIAVCKVFCFSANTILSF